ncbi:MAG: 6,7-dimethyl-8-ribityllumazine synthase [Chthoniobacterales bacterium]
MRARCIAHDVIAHRRIEASEVVHPRRGSNPARTVPAQVAHPQRAEIFALPESRPFREPRPTILALAGNLGRSIVPSSMSNQFPIRPDTQTETWRFGIVASEYNREYVDGLVGFAKDELLAIAPKSEATVVRVPGSFEIPIGVQAVIEHQPINAVLAFGVIFDGETMHAELIAGAVTTALMNLSLQHKIPILHEVLVVKTDEQAKERCLLPKINRGIEAARAAIRILSTLSNLAKE